MPPLTFLTVSYPFGWMAGLVVGWSLDLMVDRVTKTQ